MVLGMMLGMALALAACQPSQQTFAPSRQKAALEQKALVASDAAQLPLRRWLPDGRVRAVVLALHGFNDYGHGFALPGAWLAQRGVAVYAYDQRGFGGAPGRGVWPGRDNLMRDVREALAGLRIRYGRTPIYLLGESMGGAVVMATCAQAPGCSQADGLILSAPAVWGGAAMSDWYRLMLWLTVHTVPGMELTGEGVHVQASDNIEMLREMGRDPMVIKATRVDAIYGLVHLMDEAYASAEQLHQPVLLLYGAHDQVIPADAVADVAARMSPARLSAAFYPDGWHLLLRDMAREVVMRDIASWIAHPAVALPSGYGVAPELIHRPTKDPAR